MISVVGYGSLLSERSARETVPGLINYRLVEVPGHRRIFNKVGVVFFSRHGASADSLEIASCSTEPSPGSAMICAQFELDEVDFAALYEREHRYRWIEVETHDRHGHVRTGRMCTGYNDRDYRLNKCITPQEYQQRVGQYYGGALWRDDILPFPRYLAFCLQAAAENGADVLGNFLDTSFLADGITSIRQYVSQHPQLRNWREMDTGYSYLKVR
ncbi:gamma-glutamylcyclotransferase [Marinobacterium arenosum]|uniref:gamma-glutamylcyclotransferase n=1 Tax=Marinobacterium arenosum TaxID=2862496 RepID=UPI001C9749E7|nr:gamma-glutamylcyclotransferase [Marinobacterium arenosum]MBY4676354.1 gamma-glutamylcyclotransferase [Marinobacterium arenosum]